MRGRNNKKRQLAAPKRAKPAQKEPTQKGEVDDDDEVELMSFLGPWYRMPPDSAPMDPEACYIGFDICDNAADLCENGGQIVRVRSVPTAGNAVSLVREQVFRDQLQEMLTDRLIHDDDSYDMATLSSDPCCLPLKLIHGTVARSQAAALAAYMHLAARHVSQDEARAAIDTRLSGYIHALELNPRGEVDRKLLESMPIGVLTRMLYTMTKKVDQLKDEKAVLDKKRQRSKKTKKDAKPPKKKVTVAAKKASAPKGPLVASKHAMPTRNSSQ